MSTGQHQDCVMAGAMRGVQACQELHDVHKGRSCLRLERHTLLRQYYISLCALAVLSWGW